MFSTNSKQTREIVISLAFQIYISANWIPSSARRFFDNSSPDKCSWKGIIYSIFFTNWYSFDQTKKILFSHILKQFLKYVEIVWLYRGFDPY